MAVCVCGMFCLLAYYYLHARMFELYHVQVDEMMAKEYIMEVINLGLFWAMYCATNSSAEVISS